MERAIQWITGIYDEIELVYEKAESDDNIGKQLHEIERMALHELRSNCGLIQIGGKPLSEEALEALSESEKEQIICALGGAGLKSFSSTLREPIIDVTLSPLVPRVLGCTMFNLLNRLEKLDGAFNVMFPKATLLIRAPLGGKKGLFKCEMLIMQLYPWLSVREESSNEIAVGVPGVGE